MSMIPRLENFHRSCRTHNASASAEVVVGPKICLYWNRDGFMWPVACFAGPEVFAWGMTI